MQLQFTTFITMREVLAQIGHYREVGKRSVCCQFRCPAVAASVLHKAGLWVREVG